MPASYNEFTREYEYDTSVPENGPGGRTPVWVYIIALVACFIIGFGSGHAYGAPAPGPNPYCNAPADFEEFYKPDSAYIYQYVAADSEALVRTVEKRLGTMSDYWGDGSGRPSITYLAVDVDDGVTGLFFYDAKGCAVNFTDGWAKESMADLFAVSGLTAPFGPTYQQIPGTPNAPPGFTVGKGI